MMMTPQGHEFIAFCDNEGCIVDGKGLPFDLRALEDLVKYLSARPNLYFSICTGRSVPYVEAMVQALGLVDSCFPCVCEGGGVLYWPKEDRYEIVTPVVDIVSILDPIPKDMFRIEPGKFTCVSLYPRNGVTVDELAQQVATLKNIEDCNVTCSAAAVDITTRGVDKAFGMAKAFKMSGKNLKTIAIGDSDNDIPMLLAADISGSPSNATAKVKEIVKYCSRYSATAGVIDVLQVLANADGNVP